MKRSTLEEFIKKSYEVHGDKYDYSKAEYVNNATKVCIICPEHGGFWQSPVKHLIGNSCPTCSKKYRKGEKKLYFELCKTFPMTKVEHSYHNKKILDRQEIDIYFPEYKIGVEFQGEQHYRPVDFGGYGAEKAKQLFEDNKQRDIKKLKICKDNGIVIHIAYIKKINE